MRYASCVLAIIWASSVVAPGQLRLKEPPNDCSLDGFAQSAEYLIRDLAEVFKVRSVSGVIISAGGSWPDGITVLLELRGPRPAGTIRSTRTDGQGHFNLPSVPSGIYCFKATAAGWQSVVGKIEVTKDAPQESRIRFVMPIDM